MRRGEILSLTWNKVDMKTRVIRLEASDTKDREPRLIPMCAELFEVLRSLPRSISDTHVFLYRGNPVKDLRTALKAACVKANIPYGRFTRDGFVFHDLRHTFNTYMRKARIPESVIMGITGHSTREMFDRYNSIDAEDTRQAINQLEVFLKSVDQDVDQEAQKG
jgi:integrase